MNGWTPGPWKVVAVDDPHAFRHGDVRAGDEGPLLFENLRDGRGNETERLANARLIAAAPDLAEACREVEEAWTGNGDMATAVDSVLLALARAKGE